MMVLRVLNIVMFPLTLLFSLLLLLSYLAPSIRPETSILFAFLGLGYPALLLANLLLALYWIFQGKLKFIYPVTAMLIGIGHLGNYIQTGGETAPEKDKQILKIASFNVQLFGLYQDITAADTVLRTTAAIGPDVFCLQEFYSTGKNGGSTAEAFSKRLNLPYSHFETLLNSKREGKYGSLILSRFPILGSGRIDLGKTGNISCWADLKLKNGDTVRIFNVHLQSIGFRRNDYAFIKRIPGTTDSTITGGKNLLRRLKRAFIRRSEQARTVADAIRSSPHPVIVCGDFNDTPLSYTYGVLSKGLEDAYREAGSGMEKTYTGPFPSFRIDYILHSDKFSAFEYTSNGGLPSDHKLIRASLNY